MLSSGLEKLIILFLIAFIPTVISIVLYLSPKKESRLSAEKYRNKILSGLFNSSLILTIGGWLSFLSQNYIYFVIALLIGGFSFLGDLWVYFIKVKPIIDKNARIEEFILDHYDYIIEIYKSTNSFNEFSKIIKRNLNIPNEIIFNIYQNFKDYSNREGQSQKSSKEVESDVDKAYKLLGIKRNSTSTEIRKAFREKARSLHPDFTQSNDDSGFKELNNAYQLLMKISS